MIDFNLPYSKTKFIPFLEGFLPEDYREHSEEITIPFQTKYFEKVTYLGETGKLNLAVYEVQHTSENDARVGLTREMFRLMAAFGKRRSLVILVPKSGNTYRFSLVTIDLKLDENNRITKDYSNPKRYSFILGANTKLHTPQKFLINQDRVTDFEDLQKRFSVEVVNKEFYKELFDWFQWASREVRFPSGKNEEEIIRFISRIMFVWFLKQMKLIPEDIFDKRKIDTLILHTDPSESSYYKSILQNLFFATLNTFMRKDLKQNEAQVREFLSSGKMTNKHGLQYYYRYKNMLCDPEKFQRLLDDVPFLNGGLFECLDERKDENKQSDIWIDVFTQHPLNQHILVFPNKLFFESEKGLLDLFHRYNFTVEESSPIDQSVGLDPEMLGSVFENLLASYNPETRENARKATGSFYTPKQEVEFMVTISLKQYLKRKVPGIGDAELDLLFDYAVEENPFDKKTSYKIILALANIKILDPACGSGAFPMGMLNMIVLVLRKIDPDNEMWKNCQIEKALADQNEFQKRKIEIERIFNQSSNETNYARKLFVIENAINGVDIQPIAIQISKLRFFLSLVIEQEINPDSLNMGIIPLPNLETRFVCADTLLKLNKPKELKSPVKKTDKTIFGEVIPRQMNVFAESHVLPHLEIENQLKKVRHSYFEAKTIETKRKYRERDKELRERLSAELKKLGYLGLESTKIADWNPYDKSKVADWFEPEFMLGIEDGFDIVIGNPPYIQLQENSGNLAEKYKDSNYETFARTGDVYCLFYERGKQLLNNGGHLCFITSNKWMRTNYGKNTRAFLTTKTKPILIVDFGNVQIFENATVDTNILIFQNQQINKTEISACRFTLNFNHQTSIEQYILQNTQLVSFENDESWVISDSKNVKLIKKIKQVGTPLKDWEININYGLKTGLNEAFIIDSLTKENLIKEDPKSSEILKPILRGKDIQKWIPDYAGLWLIYIPWHFPLHKDESIVGATDKAEPIFRKNYKAVFEHLRKFKTELLKRNKAEIGIRYEWFALQRYGSKYWRDFDKPKIIYPNMTKYLPFIYDENEHFYHNDKSFHITGKSLKWLIAFLNSSLFKFAFSDNFPELQGGTRELRKVFFDKIPVKQLNETQQKPFIDLVDKILVKKKQNKMADISAFETQIDLMVYKLYELTYDEAMIIDPGLEQIISREDYEKVGIEELAEWEVKKDYS